jgi:hypothetical protein
MIFNTINLDWHTCIKKFEVPLQVANSAQTGQFKESSKFEFETPLY